MRKSPWISFCLTAAALALGAIARAADSPPASQPAASQPAVSATAYEVAPSNIKKQPDGSLLIDGKFVVKGEGTEASPYEIGWDLLDSAGDVYDPTDDVRKLQQGVAMLNGKYIKLVAYGLVPVREDKPTQMLAMMNQWDGCCVGVPPTPFSSIELHAPPGRINSTFNGAMVSVSGKLLVAPTLAKNWLTLFYKMEDARVSRVDF